MTCPKCYNRENKTDAFYCHNCGYQLKTRANGWAIFFAVLFVIAGITAIVLNINLSDTRHYEQEYYSLRNKQSDITSENNRLKSENNNLKNQNRNLQNENNVLRPKISSLTSDIDYWKNQSSHPNCLTYYTVNVPEAYIYSLCSNSYIKENCIYRKETVVGVYTIREGYGLTIGGYVKMSDLGR